MSWCRVHSGTCDQILLTVGTLLSESCGLVSVGRPLRPEDGFTVCSAFTQFTITQMLVFNHGLWQPSTGNVFNSRRFCAAGLTSSQVGGHHAPTFYTSNCSLQTVPWILRWFCDRRSVGQLVLVLGLLMGFMIRFSIFFYLKFTCFFT
jgi:hypothetical protein